MEHKSSDNKFMVTSGFNFESYAITEYLGFCSGECVLGTGFLSSLEAGISDFLGSTSNQYEGKLGSAKQAALDELCTNAKNLGANAIIGVDIDYITFSADIIGVIANGTAVKTEPIKSKISTSRQIAVENYNPDLSFRVPALLLSSLNGECFFSLMLSEGADGSTTALNADIVLSGIFGDEFTFHNIGFMDFSKIPGSNDKISSAAVCQIQADILPFIKSAHVIIRKYITDNTLHTATDNNLLWAEKRQRDISESVSQGLDVKKYIAQVSAFASAAEIMKFTQEINSENNCIHPELIKIISSQANLERMYGNLKDSCIEEITKYFSSESV